MWRKIKEIQKHQYAIYFSHEIIALDAQTRKKSKFTNSSIKFKRILMNTHTHMSHRFDVNKSAEGAIETCYIMESMLFCFIIANCLIWCKRDADLHIYIYRRTKQKCCAQMTQASRWSVKSITSSNNHLFDAQLCIIRKMLSVIFLLTQT